MIHPLWIGRGWGPVTQKLLASEFCSGVLHKKKEFLERNKLWDQESVEADAWILKKGADGGQFKSMLKSIYLRQPFPSANADLRNAQYDAKPVLLHLERFNKKHEFLRWPIPVFY